MRYARKAQRSSRIASRGAALLVMLLLVVLAFSSGLIYSLSNTDLERQRQLKTLEALAQAKQALIAWAVMQGDIGTDPYDRPGTLPCPDTNFFGGTNSGYASGSCSTGGGTSIGRLPWKSLGIALLRDANGEALWYALSDKFRSNPSLNPGAINSDTKGTILLYAADGSTLLTSTGEELAAIVFSPGQALPGQDRNAFPSAATSYLDSGNGRNNASAGGPFITGPAKDALGNTIVNDIVIGITARELITAIEKRVLKEAQNALTAFYTAKGNKYPNPANPNGPNCASTVTDIKAVSLCKGDPTICFGRLPEDALGPYAASWFQQNGWGRITTYAVNKNNVLDSSGAGCSGLLKVDATPASYIIVAPGTARSGQSRPTATLSDYLEDPANIDAWSGDPVFSKPSANSNDQMRSQP